MANLNNITIQEQRKIETNFLIPTKEEVGALLFDTTEFGDIFAGNLLLSENFKDGQVQYVDNIEALELLGITKEGVMNGIPYYHLSQYFGYEENMPGIYVAFNKCKEDWSYLFQMQQETNGKLFQIGIWTAQRLWKRADSGQVFFSSLISNIKAEVDEISGIVGAQSSSHTPINVIISANTTCPNGEKEMSYKELPDAFSVNAPKLSILLSENRDDNVKEICANSQFPVTVSSIGIVMALLANCGVEESIASHMTCNLNKAEGFQYPCLGIGADGSSVREINSRWMAEIVGKGYIIPTLQEDVEAACFLSSDNTLYRGDFGSIAKNRTIHKCRRAAYSSLLPFINGHYLIDETTGGLSDSAVSAISSAIYSMIDLVMRNRSGKQQIDGRLVDFSTDEEELENDIVSVKLQITPVNSQTSITENLSHSIN